MKIFRRPRTFVMFVILIITSILVAGLMKLNENSTNSDQFNWKQDLQTANQDMQQNLNRLVHTSIGMAVSLLATVKGVVQLV